MIEKQFIAQKTKEYYIQKYIENRLHGVGISQIKLKKIPLGEKIIISASKPSLIVGSKGSNIRELTNVLKNEFKLENPQIEIHEVRDIFLDANIVAQRIASALERFGSARFKSVGHKIMENVINSGALGVELIISGKIPSARAKNWRFYQGYLKKCGDLAISGVKKAKATALLKSGIIGIKVAIMPPDIPLPDRVEILSEPKMFVEEISPRKDESAGQDAGEAKPKEKKKAVRPKTASPRKKKTEKSADEKPASTVATPESAAESPAVAESPSLENPQGVIEEQR